MNDQNNIGVLFHNNIYTKITNDPILD